MTHEEVGRAVALALVRGTGTADVKPLELERASREVLTWAVHAELLDKLMHGELDLHYKQRGIGTLCIGARREGE